MTSVIITIRVFGAYLFLVGLFLLVYPLTIGGLLGAPVDTAPWLRLLGVALWALAYYYVRAASSNNRDFFIWSIHVRGSDSMSKYDWPACFTPQGLATPKPIGRRVVTLDLISPLILFPSAFEFATAVWTWFSLSTSAKLSKATRKDTHGN